MWTDVDADVDSGSCLPSPPTRSLASLSEEEVTRLAGELDAVASSFARVTSVVASDLPATSHPVPLTNVLRADVPGPTLDVDELLAGAPRAEDSMFLVPQILGEDSAS